MAEESGYAVCIPTGTASYGGCKDWFIKEFGKRGIYGGNRYGTKPFADEYA